jgi:hypothetical protein
MRKALSKVKAEVGRHKLKISGMLKIINSLESGKKPGIKGKIFPIFAEVWLGRSKTLTYFQTKTISILSTEY